MYGKFTVETADVPEQVVITESRHILADELFRRGSARRWDGWRRAPAPAAG